MHSQRRATYDEVKDRFEQDNLSTPGRNGFPRGALEIANRQFVTWAYVILTPKEVLSVLLPKHDHAVNLIPPDGASVSEAISVLDRVNRQTECYQRIEQFSGALTPPVFLSTSPISDPQYSDYHGLLRRGCTGLTHLDGLHRLIAWGQENRRDVPAFVAGLT